MCDGCKFGNHPSQFYHIRSITNPEGCLIPPDYVSEDDEEKGEYKKKKENKEEERKKENTAKVISPLLFGNLTQAYFEFWHEFKEGDNYVEDNAAEPLPLQQHLRQCGCLGEKSHFECGRKGDRNYYEHQND